MNKQKIGLFLGTNRGYEVLKALIDNKKPISNVLVLQQQSHELEDATDKIISLCKDNAIPYKTSAEVKSKDYEEYLSTMQPDIVFAISWRFLIPTKCFSIPTHGIFILHDSLLPRYRGASPTNWVIINGEKETGLSLQYISAGVDEGDLVDQIRVPLSPKETAETLNDKFLCLYPEIILKNVDLILSGQNKRTPQDAKKATFGCRRSPEDGKLDFHQDTQSLDQLIRGTTYPYPGAFCFYKDKKVIVWEAEVVKDPPIYEGKVPGKVINITSEYVDVLTGDGVLRILRISDFDNPKEFLKPKSILNSISASLY